MISEQLLAEEDLAKGDILDTSNQKIASLVVFTTKAGSKISCIKWRSPETTLISQKTESS
jgi:poly(3-hydroxyalkanoate) synthetase